MSLLLTATLVFSFFVFPAPEKASAIYDHHMNVFPRKVDTIATYQFKFSIEEILSVSDWIKLEWPVEVTFPTLPEDRAERDRELKRIIESMSIGLSPCTACQGLPIITDTATEKSIRFNTHVELNPDIEGYRDITITVPDVVGIRTPKEPGEYVFRISNQAEPTPVPSEPFRFVKSQIGYPEGIPVVEVTPPSFRSPASYNIAFNVGEGGWLKGGEGIIRLRFPEGTVFSRDVIAENAVFVNGRPLAARISPRGNNLVFNTPIEIADSERVEIELTERAGIINPSQPGEYTIDVSTMPADPQWVSSEPYEIVKGGAMLSVDPPNVNKVASYSFAFILDDNERLRQADQINILFPEGTTLPSNIPSSAAMINNTPAVNVNVSDYEVTLYSGIEVPSGGTVEVYFSADAGIVNRTQPGEITLGYKLQQADEYMFTLPVVLAESALEVGDIIIEPRNASSSANWTIPIRLGDNGALATGDYIGITFPENASIPSAIDPSTILLNDEEANTIEIEDSTVHIYVPRPFADGANIIVNINRESGIQNPDEERVDYFISVFTSKEPEAVNSEIFGIAPPLPDVSIEIKGGEIGRNDWYIMPPRVHFTSSSEGADIYVYANDMEEQTIRYTGTPTALEMGQYIRVYHFYAQDVHGRGETSTFEIKVDTVPPGVNMTSPTERRILTNEPGFTISGNTTSTQVEIYGVETLVYDTIVMVNGEHLDVSETDGTFSMDLVLDEGDNDFLIRVEDEAGNYITREYTVMLDTTPPEVEITYPVAGGVVTTQRAIFKGNTEPGSMLLIDGEVVFLEEDGSFEHEVRLREVGFVGIEIEAIDAAGNSNVIVHEFWFGYTIILQIGNNQGITNDEEKTMDVPPFISNGRTLVPFRFIGEQLNAEIDFTVNEQTRLVEDVIYELGDTRIVLTIGKTEATVNGQSVTMDVPAQIVQGRTVVPIRFVAEALGCEVGWDGSTETITIKFPKI